MTTSSSPILRLTAALLALASLGGCVTPRAKPVVSQAVLQARAANDVQTDPCAQVSLAAISPTSVTFEFQSAVMSVTGQRHLEAAASWLSCAKGGQLVVAGYADARGTAEAQNALADSRATAVLAYLQQKHADTTRVRIVPAAQVDAGKADNAGTEILVVRAQGGGW